MRAIPHDVEDNLILSQYTTDSNGELNRIPLLEFLYENGGGPFYRTPYLIEYRKEGYETEFRSATFSDNFMQNIQMHRIN